jgi:hypothetical protein
MPQPGAGAPKKSPTVPLLVALLCLAVLGGGAVVLLSASDSSSTAAGGSPEEAVRGFYEAFEQGDCEAMMELITAAPGGDAQALADCESSMQSGALDTIDFSIDDVKVVDEQSDTATVEVTGTAFGETSTQPITVVKEDGKWKIDGSSLNALDTTSPEGIDPPDNVIEGP